MPESTAAWLLPISEHLQFCIAEYQAEAYISNTAVKTLPLATNYCCNIVFWQNKMLPVVDLSKMTHHLINKDETPSVFQHIFIVAYQVEDYKPLEYIGFKLSAAPKKINIENTDICEIPDEYPEQLKPYLLSLFNHKDKLTSVFNIAAMTQA